VRPSRNGEGVVKLEYVNIHGQRVGYRTGGSGPALLLIHGMAGSSRTWKLVAPALAEHYTVVAPDLLGHGESAKPRGDYSLGAHASGLRDLMVMLGHERATVVGQSLGGGIAMQFAYMFPSRVERLVLVASGGLGREVNPILRFLAVPGSEYVLPLATAPVVRDALPRLAGLLGRIGVRPDPGHLELWRAYESLAEPQARTAFVHTLRSVVDVAGQRVSAANLLYLAAEIPTLIVWGDRDAVIPVEHARTAHARLPASRLEIIAGAGHFPHCERSEQFVAVLRDFMLNTRPGDLSDERWLHLLRTGHLRPASA
jgi:pimeloyl-ACP methyl ester carboxylesterase